MPAGDPQQLDQPLQGTHPPGAEASALGHVLAGESTMAPDRGLFLARTRRLHPDLVRVRVRTPRQMHLANALCRFLELAGAGTGGY